jgi:hypothetical protein
MNRWSIAALSVTSATLATLDARAQAPWRAELSLMPFFREQQVEGVGRDDRVQREGGLFLFATASRDLSPWLAVGASLGFDAGSSFRATYDRPGPAGVADERARIDVGWWELWLGPSVTLRWRALFADVIWAPLTVRSDPSRTDLFNTRGENVGLFLGNPWISFALAAGAEVPLSGRAALVLRVNFRLRYTASRGGAALERDQEAGQMFLWPVAGLRLRW